MSLFGKEPLKSIPDDDPASDKHPYNTGMQIWESGPGSRVYVDLQDMSFWKDIKRTVPATDRDAARAGVNVQYFRAERRALQIKASAAEHAERIRQQGAAALREGLKSPDVKLREKANALAEKYLKATAELNQQRELERQHTAKVRAAGQN